ncbi:MAG: hypothetical protein O3B44_06810 [Bacteroidetes bacterium]|nr:hypothetical protein [Bacteroidota bacterium]
MQILDASHPIEIYEKTQQNWFDIQDGQNFDFPYRFVFGLRAVDNGNVFEPSDQGSPVFEPFSDVYAREVQQYLFDFCNHIDEWALTPQSEASLEINPCSMYVFKSWMEHECTETGENGEGDYLAALPVRNNCCGYTDNNFPYDANEFSMCIRDWATYWGGQHEYNHGLWFDGEGTLKVIVMEGSSTEKYSEIFDVTDAYFKNLLAFF